MENKLELIIITFNRSKYLDNTLKQLFNSRFRLYNITVLNNKSTDNTIDICNKYELNYPNFRIITNKVNIGLSANIIKAVETSSSVYTWIICDDDEFDFSNVDDVFEVINDERADLIHMGAHEIKDWNSSGVLKTPKELIKNGYPYFLYGSFLPCNLFKTSSFYQTIIAAYDNVNNMYPHMPLVFDFFLNDKLIYVPKIKIVKARMSGQSYDYLKWLKAWTNTCQLLPKKYSRIAFYDQFDVKSKFILMRNLSIFLSKEKNDLIFLVKLFKILTTNDRLLLLLFLPLANLYGFFRNKYK